MKIRSLNMLRTILKTSYDTTGIINEETGKLNKKSIKIWILAIFSVMVIYLSYIAINSLKRIGAQLFYLDLFFMILDIIVMVQATLLTLNIMYFQDDIKNYIYMPISSLKLMITRFGVVLSLILGTEILIAIPSIFIFGVRTIKNILFYPVSLIVIFLVTVYLVSIITIIISILIKMFKFIKNRRIYQNIILVIMTFIIIVPLLFSIKNTNDFYNNKNMYSSELEYSEEQEESNTEEIEELSNRVFKLNRVLIIPNLAIKTLSEFNLKGIFYIFEMIGIDLCLMLIVVFIGRKTYLKNVLYVISMFNKKKERKINVEKKCKVIKKEKSYLKKEFKILFKNQIYFMQYIYKISIILIILINLAIVFIPIFKSYINTQTDIQIVFDFEALSIIIGLIQILFTFSASSLTAFSRYGRNAKFFKYIPIELKKQFFLKVIPGICINSVVIIIILTGVKVFFQGISYKYILLMFVISMLLNIINNYILLLIDIWRPQLHLDSEISVIKQNENKILKYILTVLICFILWYLKEVTEKLTLNTAIIIEIIVLSIILVILNIIVLKKNDKLFKRII